MRFWMPTASLGLAISVAASGAIAHGYTADFQTGVGAEWSTTTRTTANTFTTFLGRFANHRVNLTVDTVAGADYELTFDLYIIDSWDGTSSRWGTDTFGVMADETTLLRETFTNGTGPATFTGTPTEGGPGVNLGFTSRWADSIYRGMTLGFTAADVSTVITFFGHGLQGISDESWGIDNVSIAQVSVPAPGGAALAALAVLAAMGRESRPRKPLQ